MTRSTESERLPETNSTDGGEVVTDDTIPGSACGQTPGSTGTGARNDRVTTTGERACAGGRAAPRPRGRRDASQGTQAWNDAMRLAGLALSAPERSPSAASEECMFPPGIRADIQPVGILDCMVRALMEYANVLEDRWTRIQPAAVAGERRKGNEQKILTRQRAVFRELGKQLVMHHACTDRADAAVTMVGEACVRFVREMTGLYLRISTRHLTIVRDAVNQYLAGTINGADLARKLTPVLADRGEELEQEAQRLSEQIAESVFKRTGCGRRASRHPAS